MSIKRKLIFNYFSAIILLVISMVLIFACGGGGGGGDSGGSGLSFINSTAASSTTANDTESILVGETLQYTVSVSDIPGESFSFQLIDVQKLTEAIQKGVVEAVSSEVLYNATIDPATGVISWTASEKGTYIFTIGITNNLGSTYTETLEVIVITPEENTGPVITAQPGGTAAVGQPYTYQVYAEDLHTPLTYSLTVSPEGMAIDLSGLVTWAPSSAYEGQTVSVSIRVADRYGAANSLSMAIVVSNTGPVITDIDAQIASIGGMDFSYQVSATDNDQPLSFALENNPYGMVIDSNGLITWSPSELYAGTTLSITVKATDKMGNYSTKIFSLEVRNILPVITPIDDRSLAAGTLFTYFVEAVDANTPLTYELTTAPAGMTIDSTGQISWPTTSTGDFPVTVTVTDSLGGASEESFVITVTNDGPAISSIPNQTATTGVLKNISVNAVDTNTPLTYALTDNVPPGMTIDSATGEISWTPQSSDSGLNYNNVAITVSDVFGAESTISFNIAVDNVAPVINAIPDDILNVSDVYTYDVVATDNNTPLSYSLSGEPTGMTIDGNGTISFTPANMHQGSVYTITVRATDAHASNPLYVEDTFQISVNNLAPVVNNIPDQEIGLNECFLFDFASYAFDENMPLVYAIDGGSTNVGANPAPSIDADTGYITWTPTAATGSFVIGVSVTDQFAASTIKTFNINVSNFIITSSSTLPTVAKNGQYNYQLLASGGALPYTWSVIAGALPNGLTLDANTGIISGTATVANNFNFTIQVLGGGTANKAFTISVIDGPVITSENLPSGFDTLSYSTTLQISGGTTPYRWFVLSGTLPTGLSIAEATGIISGTPTDVGLFSFSIIVIDDNDLQYVKAFSIKIFSAGVWQDEFFNDEKIESKVNIILQDAKIRLMPSESKQQFMQEVTITDTTGGDLKNYQVRLIMPYVMGKMNTDYSDLRVTDTSGNPLPYWFEDGVPANFGDGTDGDITISAAKNINTDILAAGRVTYADGISYAVTAIGANTVTTSVAPGGIIAGDEILLINLQGNSGGFGNAGTYEFLKVQNVAGSILTLTSDIAYIYGKSSSNADLTGQKIIVQRVPNYNNVSITGTGSLTCSAWNGTQGGVIVFRAAGTISIAAGGSISANTKGYRGGTQTGGSCGGGQGGESMSGVGGDGGTWSSPTIGNNGAAGGGSCGNTQAQGGDAYSGGGGGASNTRGGYGSSTMGGSGGGGSGRQGSAGGAGHGTPGNGGVGNSSANGQNGGIYVSGNGGVTGLGGGGGGGGTYGNPELNKIYFGSGGGKGGRCNSRQGGSGGTGGGIIVISGNTITNAGSITSNGSNGGNYNGNDSGGGGGASGGSIYLAGANVTLGTNIILASGGTGGSGTAGAAGAGGVGRIRVDYDTISGSTSPVAFTKPCKAVIWTKVPFIPASGDATIRVLYGNTDATDQSDGESTFMFYDGFENLDKWTVTGSTVNASGGIVYFDYGSNPCIYTGISASSPYIAETKYLHNTYYRNRLYVNKGNLGSPTGYDYGIFTPSIYFGASTGVNLDPGTWYIIRWTISPSDYIWSQIKTDYSVLLDNPHGSAITGLNRWVFRGTESTDSDFQLDWARIRKYASSEPNVAFGAEQPTTAYYAGITSAAIIPSSLSAWGNMWFSDSKASNGGPANTNIKYFIEYYSSGDWLLIPDADLAGNSAGFTSSPVNISGLNVVTYSKIRLRATLSTTDINVTPTLIKWGATWAP